ncbi:MAG: PAS domain-containing protein, partial [Pseudomonadota bacterium]|nr:PAS domain-containing protein [Pseudomonadota bacterium]
FYNDAYTPILTGGKHPAALGLSVRESFPEIWDFIGPLFDQVLNKGESVAMENAGLMLYRDGLLQESFFSFSYSPLKSLAGKVCGVTTVCWETTEEVIIKRRERGLRLLTEQLVAATSLEQVHHAMRSHVEGNRGDLPLLLWYERDEVLNTLRLVMSCGISGEAPLIRELGAQDGRSKLGQAIDSTAPVARLLCLPEPATEWLLDAPSAMEVENVAIEPLCYVNYSVPDAYLVFGVSRRPFDASSKNYLESICHGVERAVRRISAVEFERRENLRQFAEVTAVVPSLLWMTDADGACTFVSKRWLDFTGRTELESLADAWKSGIHPDDHADVEDARRVALANRAPLNMQYRFLRADGQYRWMMVEALPRHDDRGNFLGMVGSSLDITERRQAQLESQETKHTLEQSLVELQKEQKRLLDAQRVAKVGSWETNLIAGSVTWSDETHRIHETQPGEFEPTHEHFLQLVHPDDRQRVDQALADSMQTGDGVIEHRLLLPDGRIKYVEERWQIDSDATGTPVRAIGTCQDVSERERAESVLRNTSDRLALATQSAQIGIWDWDVLSNTLVWDAQMLRLYGLREGGFGESYKVWALSLHPDDRERVLTEVSDAVAGIRDYDSQFRIFLPDGQLRYIEARGLVQRAADGTALRMIGVNRDISEQMQAESVLRNLGDRLSLATQSAEIGIWDWDVVGNTLVWDAQMLRLYGLGDVEFGAVYEAWVQCLHPDDSERIQSEISAAVAGIREY